MASMDAERDVWTISRLNREARELLESGLQTLWLEGELSNLAQPASGHIYFSLKDADAQVRCAMFRTRRQSVSFRPTAGMQVLVRGRVSLYEPRGDFQVIVDRMEEAGAGALQRAFEALKAKLAAEGLFAEADKRPLPSLPRRIGVVTSPSGAAIRDVVSVLSRRFPAIPVIVYPVPVQGEGAAERIVAALRTAAERAECDVLLLVRGGGSIEDLWAFNDEGLARAIRACPIPVVSGVGHEIDFTIADFVADRRAPTPSAAAELVVPDRRELRAHLARLARGLQRLMGNHLERADARFRGLLARLRPLQPGRRIEQQGQRLDELEQRLRRAWMARHSEAATRISSAARALNAVSPLATLTRGYAIVTRTGQERPVVDATTLEIGDSVEARFASGNATLKVERTGASG